MDRKGGNTVIVAYEMGRGLYLKHGLCRSEDFQLILTRLVLGHGIVRMECLRSEGREGRRPREYAGVTEEGG